MLALQNICLGIFVIPLSNSAVSTPEPLKVLSPLSSVFGIYISFNDSQPENASYPNVVILGGNLKFDKFVHPEKARLPISVTLFGIVTEYIFLLFWNAKAPIFVTLYPSIVDGTATAEAVPL